MIQTIRTTSGVIKMSYILDNQWDQNKKAINGIKIKEIICRGAKDRIPK